MPRPRFCPECDADISDTYESAEPDVGILSGGWYCEECDIFISEDEVDEGE